jgi:signal peptidase I
MLARPSRRYEDYRTQGTLSSRLRRLIKWLVLVFLLYEAVTLIAVQSISIETTAMQPTIEPGDRALLVPLVYGPRVRVFRWQLPGFRAPQRGDIAAVRPGFREEAGFLVRLADPFVRFFTVQRRSMNDEPVWNNEYSVKRVIGLPGDTIRIERFTAYVRPAGEQEFQSEFTLADREYELRTDDRPELWEPLDPFGAAGEDLTLGDDEYFVLSDNRSGGSDSRHWGTIDRSAIHGAVLLRYWPLSRFGRL